MQCCKSKTAPIVPTNGEWKVLSSVELHSSNNSVVSAESCPIGADNCQTVAGLSGIIETQRAIATSDLDLPTVMQLICERAKDLTHASGSIIAMAEDDRMVYKATSDSIRAQVGSSLPIANSLSGLCVTTGQLLQSHDTENDSRVNRQACRVLGIGSMIVVPLVHHGTTVGVLKLISDQKNFFNQTAVDVLQLLAGIMAAALSNSLIMDANRRLIRELQEAMSTVKHLNGLLPICCKCQKIRDDGGAWKRLEVYITERSDARFSHGYCPQCADEFLKEAGLRK